MRSVRVPPRETTHGEQAGAEGTESETPHPPKVAVVAPAGRLAGRLPMPGDKSVSHRALMLGALCRGVTEVAGWLDAADTRSTAAAIERLGARVEHGGPGRLRVVGRGGEGLSTPDGPIDCGNSGTTLRLLAGLLAGQGVAARLVGDASLSRRPMGRIVDPLRSMGYSVEAEGEGRRPPVVLSAGRHRPPTVTIVSPVASAQVKSCVLLAGLRALGPVTVREPAPSRDHTERLLRYLGASVVSSPNYGAPDGRPATVCLTPEPDPWVPEARPIQVPGDISSAAFWLVGAVVTRSTEVHLEGVSINPTRVGLLDVLAAMGVKLRLENRRVLPGGEPVADLNVAESGRPIAGRIDGGLIPRLVDEIPILAVLASQSDGDTVIADAAELRVKESDRLAATARLLRSAGARVEERSDGLRVPGPCRLRAFTYDAQGDHRMAMAAAVAALVADGPCEIVGADACAVSYAAFFDDLARLRDGGDR